jgi:TolA-binding protein
MKKRILFYSIALLPLAVLSNEPSAFGGGNSSGATASSSNFNYKITTSEKVIPHDIDSGVNQRQSSSAVNVESSTGKTEEYEGVRSVVDGYANKIAKMDERIRSLEKANEELSNQFKNYIDESRKLRTEDQEKIKVVLVELSSIVDSINKNYVSKDQLNNKSASKTTTLDATKKDAPKDKPLTSKELSSKDSATLIKDADTLYEKKSYGEAKVIYDELLHRNYKPAKVNFTLGEIAYNQKSYAAAIEYYKTSISLFDKAAYTPTLLLNTASSFEKLGKNKEAQAFYKALKDGYPTSPEAKKAK